MVAGQFRHSRALHDTSNILDLLGLLRQLGITLELLAEVARIGTAKPRLSALPTFRASSSAAVPSGVNR
jgi:hypothetical protein